MVVQAAALNVPALTGHPLTGHTLTGQISVYPDSESLLTGLQSSLILSG